MNLTFRPHVNPTSRAIDEEMNAGVLAPGQSRRDLLFQRAEEYEFKKAIRAILTPSRAIVNPNPNRTVVHC